MRTCCLKCHWTGSEDTVNYFFYTSFICLRRYPTRKQSIRSKYPGTLSFHHSLVLVHLQSIKTNIPHPLDLPKQPRNQYSFPYRRHASLHALLHKPFLVRFPKRSSINHTGASFLTCAVTLSLYWSAVCWTPFAFSSGAGGVSLRSNVDGSGAFSTTQGASSSPSLGAGGTCGGGPLSAEISALVIDIAGST